MAQHSMDCLRFREINCLYVNLLIHETARNGIIPIMPKIYRDYVVKGICPSCKSKPARKGVVLCQKCWESRMSPERKAKQRELARKYKAKNRELGLCDRCKKPQLEGKTQCKECSEAAINKARKLRRDVFGIYDNKCRCCGEKREEFLTIDHVNGGGGQERKSGFNIYLLRKRLLKSGVDPSYQILCMNCNFAKGIHGYCPHEKE